MSLLKAVVFAVVLAGLPWTGFSQDARTLFDKRIVPILKSPNPSSCAECHLSGVDLKDYIRETQTETFAALVKGGLVDLKKPEASKLLEFIRRAPQQPTPFSERVRKEELQAFSAWIRAAVNDPELLKVPLPEQAAGSTLPVEVIRHARQDQMLVSFVENIWNEVNRCAACHSPDQNAKQVKEHGERVSWIRPRDPAATLRALVDASLIDTEDPAQSLLLLKPTNTVKHGGGVKMVVGDRSYRQFRRFIDDYAATANGKYKTPEELPQPADEVSLATEIWFKLTDVPEAFDQKVLQVDVYRADPSQPDRWSADRWASSDRQVYGKGRLWQHSLSLTAPRNAARVADWKTRPALPPGEYLVRIRVDQTGKYPNPAAKPLDDSDLVGEVVVDSRWPTGYGAMTAAKYPRK
ncbi:hypothetical protein [Planctellipticum variicoloris]|uniref:hypothetical protein n=1 Tax=Planctellipticum variicoloris TaxID=3064265 RepID=UPI00301323CD|nr:hypothetical protein SH412_001914 [Planctomycetaceae bacterium SH412]